LTTGWEVPQARRCECGADDCDAVIYMTWQEQDRTDHAPKRWAIAKVEDAVREDLRPA
jgi:hypothetical protein